MGIQALFETRGGLTFGGAYFLTGAGIPGGDGGFQDEAPIGSSYQDESNGEMYLKRAAGTGTDKWVRMQHKGDMDSALLGLSWRVPAKVRDVTSYADLAAAETAVNTGTIDGVTIADTSRILFEGISGAAKNVFIVTGTPGSGATLVEDSNTATKGDALFVQDGTSAGMQFSFNGTAWVQQGASSQTEAGFIQAFIGKSGNGNETPDYSSSQVVTDGTSLETAIGALDAAVGTAIQDLDALETKVGSLPWQKRVADIYTTQYDWSTFTSLSELASNISAGDLPSLAMLTPNQQVLFTTSICGSPAGLYTYNGSTFVLDPTYNAFDGDVFSVAMGLTGGLYAGRIFRRINGGYSDILNSSDQESGYIRDYVGKGETGGVAPQYSSNNVVADGDSLRAAIDKLDAAAKVGKKADAVTAAVVVDSVLVDAVLAARWTVHARSVATPAKVFSGEILAMHNGTSTTDATSATLSQTSIIKLGGNINGLNFTVDLDGTGTSQVLRLKAVSTDAINVRVARSVLNEQ